MSHPQRRRRASAVMAAGAFFGVGAFGAGPALAAEPTQDELVRELRALREKVERLEAAAAADGGARDDSRASAAEVDATVDSVLRDADRRSQLLQASGFTAGYDKGKFTIQSEDGNFKLSPDFQFQARYVLNYREEDAPDAITGDATSDSGLEIRRMKMAFQGNVFSPDTKYKFQWASSRNGGALTLEEAYVTHKLSFAPDFFIKAGQYKDVTFHEEITSSKRQLAVDRSLANEVLAGGITDFIQGVALVWDDGPDGLPIRGEAGYTDGPNSDNTNFVDGGGSATYGVASPDFGVYARAEYLAFGDWKYYDDFSAVGNVQDLLVVGGGAFYTQAGDNNALFHTVDVQYEMNRLGLYGAFYGVYSDSTGADGDSSYDAGLTAQAGYVLDDKGKWEVFGRYSLVSFDGDEGTGSDDDDFHEFTTGVNYFMHGHAAKLTVDVTYLPNGVPTDQNGIGELDPDADTDQFVLRGQFQLLL